MLLEGFVRRDVVTPGGVRIATWTAGDGPPVLLLHGWPQDHHMWHAVAPDLARDHTVVLTDLRGYGESDAPPPGERSAAYAKRAMATDQLAVMDALGHDRFALVGHDRGARVGHRLALDAPERLTGLAVIDIVPTRHVLETADQALARAYFHWFLLGAPAPVPENVLGADPTGWVRTVLGGPLAGGCDFHPDALAGYVKAHERPEVLAGTIGDYRRRWVSTRTTTVPTPVGASTCRSRCSGEPTGSSAGTTTCSTSGRRTPRS
ncbi:hypothetical protein GCM10011519_08520 [Marmoricola endophyticus]|uniref:AB hydrolase-1 domain-containing protein n=1 Tax=Marmoricola endophyticus TaxID=2040280 RepID=A0A917F0V9_9ACTN|nr:alpha/beta hydrolase [Marmoricola endophyticus]GGF37295.1 hypothetical protein GCM10011519_08520 [Marmoricola endophyticus]